MRATKGGRPLGRNSLGRKGGGGVSPPPVGEAVCPGRSGPRGPRSRHRTWTGQRSHPPARNSKKSDHAFDKCLGSCSRCQLFLMVPFFGAVVQQSEGQTPMFRVLSLRQTHLPPARGSRVCGDELPASEGSTAALPAVRGCLFGDPTVPPKGSAWLRLLRPSSSQGTN